MVVLLDFFNPKSIARELDVIAKIRADLIQIMLIWMQRGARTSVPFT